MEVLLGAKDQCFALGYTFDLVRPLPGNLNGRLYGLCSRVHRQNHVITEHPLDLLGPLWKHIIVKGSRTQGQPPGLLNQSLDKLWMAMALVDGTIGRQEVEVVVALGIINIHALRARENNGKRMVVVSGKFILGSNCALC